MFPCASANSLSLSVPVAVAQSRINVRHENHELHDHPLELMDLHEDEHRTIVDALDGFGAAGLRQTCRVFASMVRTHGPAQKRIARAKAAIPIFNQVLKKIRDQTLYYPETEVLKKLRGIAPDLNAHRIGQIADSVFFDCEGKVEAAHKARWLGAVMGASSATAAQAIANRIAGIKARDSADEAEHKVARAMFVWELLETMHTAPESVYEPFVQLACDNDCQLKNDMAFRYMSTAQCDRLGRKLLSNDTRPERYGYTAQAFRELPYFSQAMRDELWEKVSAIMQISLAQKNLMRLNILATLFGQGEMNRQDIFNRIPAQERARWASLFE
jgi:hypothetical protein